MEPLLSVLIPTFNRGTYLPGIFRFFEQVIDSGLLSREEFQLIISENHSKDETAVYLRSLPDKLPIRIVVPPEHLPTAEQNLHFGMQRCDGKFIWILGDDDSPNIDVFAHVVQLLREDSFDFIMCNASGAQYNGTLVDNRTYCSDEGQIKDLLDFVRRVGLVFVMAGFSTTVIRRSMAIANLQAMKGYFDISPIYSHVFWQIETFASARFNFVNQCLVAYKQNASDAIDTGHWQRVAEKHNTFEKYFWSLGIVRMARRLRERTKIPAGWFGEIIDQDWLHRYHFLDSLLKVAIMQMKMQQQRLFKAIPMKDDEFQEICSFLISELPAYNEFIARMKVFSGNPPDLSNENIEYLENSLMRYSDGRFSRRYLVSSINGWSVYYFHNLWRACIYDPSSDESTYLMRDIAPVATQNLLLADSYQEIAKLCRANDLARKSAKIKGNSKGLTAGDIAFVIRLRRLAISIKKLIPRWLRQRLI